MGKATEFDRGDDPLLELSLTKLRASCRLPGPADGGSQRNQLNVTAREVPLFEAQTDTQPQIWAGERPGASLFPLCMGLSAFFSVLPMPSLRSVTKGVLASWQACLSTGRAGQGTTVGQGQRRQSSNIMTVSNAPTQAHTLGPDSVLSCKPKMCLFYRGKCVWNSNCLHLYTCNCLHLHKFGGCTSGLPSSRSSAPGPSLPFSPSFSPSRQPPVCF